MLPAETNKRFATSQAHDVDETNVQMWQQRFAKKKSTSEIEIKRENAKGEMSRASVMEFKNYHHFFIHG